MELTPRLQGLADLVQQGTRLADVGTDHAYLPVWLLLQGRITSAIAADLRPGPLSRARETAERYGVGPRISFRLCDGLSNISPDEVDVIAIAGLGGETIAAILEAAPWTREGKRLLLQPMTSFPDLRLWLQRNGYSIEQEYIVREGKRLYSIWDTVGGSMPPYTPGELWAGRRSREPLRSAYVSMIAEKVNKALQGHLAASAPDPLEIDRLNRVLAELQAMEQEGE